MVIKLKLRDRVKNKVNDWLGVTDLDIATTKAQREINHRVNTNLDDAISFKRYIDNKVSHNQKSIEHLHKTIQSVVHIALMWT